MYFARAQYVFTDNDLVPEAIGKGCAFWFYKSGSTLNDPTIADLLIEHGNSFAFYAEGYAAMKQALLCPEAPPDCTSPLSLIYGGTCNYDPSDVPFEYYMNFVDNPTYMKDLGDLANDIAAGTLPDVTFVKGLAYHSEHPNNGTTVSNGVQFVSTVVDQILQSPYAADTLILLTWDEGGGFFDHVAPPQQPGADGKPYGTRIPLLAIGPFARSNEVSHVVMEHSSIVKFIEWNYLGATGQLGGRDAVVNNLGSLLDPAMTGTAVPQ